MRCRTSVVGVDSETPGFTFRGEGAVGKDHEESERGRVTALYQIRFPPHSLMVLSAFFVGHAVAKGVRHPKLPLVHGAYVFTLPPPGVTVWCFPPVPWSLSSCFPKGRVPLGAARPPRFPQRSARCCPCAAPRDPISRSPTSASRRCPGPWAAAGPRATPSGWLDWRTGPGRVWNLFWNLIRTAGKIEKRTNKEEMKFTAAKRKPEAKPKGLFPTSTMEDSDAMVLGLTATRGHNRRKGSLYRSGGTAHTSGTARYCT